MSTVAEIKAAIDRLSPQERCELEALLHPDWDDDWDRQMKQDAANGKFDEMNRKADDVQAAGKTTPLNEILGES
jgi:hypothetical protein